MKLRKKLVLVIGLAVCTVFLLACFLLMGYLLQILTQESIQMQTYELEQSADRMNTLVERAYETATSIAADSSVQHIVAQSDVSPMEYLVNQKELEYQLSMHINVNPNFAAVFVIGENGVQYSNSDQYVQYSLREEEWFDAALRSSEPFFLSDKFFFSTRGAEITSR